MPNDKRADDGAAIDPRYDPAFQRGFAGEVATGPRGQSTLRRTAAVNPAPARMAGHPVEQLEPATGEQPDPRPARVSERDAVLSAPGGRGEVEVHGAPVGTAPITVATPRELIRNPFMIALAALAALLILVGAIWAYEGFATIVRNGGTRNETEFWAAQTMSFGAPLAIVAGLSVVAVLLVIFGRSWQRTRAL